MSHAQAPPTRASQPSSLGPLVMISPHCDDAVLSCGDLLLDHGGAVVVTVFAGSPPAPGALTAWDEAAGFAPGDDVMAARRAEDRAALTLLGARPVWLEFHDRQYGPSPSREAVAERVEAVVREAAPRVVAVPLGLVHPDHVLAHEACLLLLCRHANLVWLAYEDAVYRAFPDDPVARRLRALVTAGFGVERVDRGGGEAGNAKRAAMACYRSQLRALSGPSGSGYADALAPERYWRLTPPAAVAGRGAGCA
jgi:LmbE family N-acetylglucosaminyl deacetylase